jgi:hypothetical protein
MNDATSGAVMEPRLIDTRAAAAYCGVSFWTLRDWLLAGHIPHVQLPPTRPRAGARAPATLRRALVDVRDLDAFIDARKSSATNSLAARGAR